MNARRIFAPWSLAGSYSGRSLEAAQQPANWFSSVIGALGETRGLDLFRDIVARNGISIRKGHSLLANLVVSGEVPLALTAYGYRVDELKKRGAPIDKVYLPPVIVLLVGPPVIRVMEALVRP